MAIYSLPTRLILGPAVRCSKIGAQESFTITPLSATTGTISASGLTDLLHRSVWLNFTDGSVACATILGSKVPTALGRVNFVKGVVGTLYFIEEDGKCTLLTAFSCCALAGNTYVLLHA